MLSICSYDTDLPSSSNVNLTREMIGFVNGVIYHSSSRSWTDFFVCKRTRTVLVKIRFIRNKVYESCVSDQDSMCSDFLVAFPRVGFGCDLECRVAQKISSSSTLIRVRSCFTFFLFFCKRTRLCGLHIWQPFDVPATTALLRDEKKTVTVIVL